jgi:hypothetical protein
MDTWFHDIFEDLVVYMHVHAQKGWIISCSSLLSIIYSLSEKYELQPPLHVNHETNTSLLNIFMCLPVEKREKHVDLD